MVLVVIMDEIFVKFMFLNLFLKIYTIIMTKGLEFQNIDILENFGARGSG
jgi:hypothetical protein